MPMSRTPRQLLTSWVNHKRPRGAPEMNIGRTIEKALRYKGLSKTFAHWRDRAQDRPEWRRITHPHDPKYGGRNVRL